MLNVECFERVVDLPGEEWNALTGPGDFFLSQPWLRVVEATAGAPIRYLLSRRNGQLAAGLTAVLGDHTTIWPLGRPDTVLLRCASEGLPGAAECRDRLPDEDLAGLLLPSLICGGRHLGRNRVLYNSIADDETLADLVASAEELARQFGAASTCFLYVDEQDDRLREILTTRGYLSFTSARYSQMSLPGGGFAGYLDMLTPHRRKRVRAEHRRLTAAGLDRRIEPMTATMIPRLAELESALFAKYGLSHWRAESSAKTISEIFAQLGREALISSVWADGEIRGFCLILPFKNTWYAHRAGFDYDFQGKLPLYYELLYYQPIEAAEKCGVSTIYYGIGSEQAKLSRGCVASTQYCYLRPFGTE